MTPTKSIFLISIKRPNNRSKSYKVSATTFEDALQIAYALDGRWVDSDATDMLEFAKLYCGDVRVLVDGGEAVVKIG